MKIDFRNVLEDKVGEHGLPKNFVLSMEDEVKSVKTKFLQEKENLGFTKLGYEEYSSRLKEVLKETEKLGKSHDTVVVIGIGGSDLGARAVFQALCHQFHNQMIEHGKTPEKYLKNAKKMYFLGDTTDPQPLSNLFDLVDLETTLFIVVSKSGNTIEQASNFVQIRDRIIAELGEGKEVDHFLFITDPKSGTLRALSQRHGFKTASVPQNVGGRFSVLSTVGMIPAQYMGLDTEKMLQGAKDLDEELAQLDYKQDYALKYAVAQLLMGQKDKNITILMPYIYSLYDFSRWFKQLWGESLGKKVNKDGEVVHTGTTPVAALGPTDQHSQLQLYNEGPNDKLITFITAEKSKNNMKMPADYDGVQEYEFFKGHDMQEILNAEHATTAYALTKNNRPNITISIEKLDEYTLGQLFYFFEVVTAYMGYFLNIDAYNQPGVELSKNAMYGYLEKEGYEKEREEFEKFSK